MVLSGWRLLKETVQCWNVDRAPRMGAALAYYSLFSLAPLLLIVTGIAGMFFGEEETRARLLDRAREVISPAAADLLGESLASIRASGDSLRATLIGIALLFFGASGALVELVDDLNTIWKVPPRPGLGIWSVVRGRLVAFVIMLVMSVLLLAALVVSTTLHALERLLGDVTDAVPGGMLLWQGASLGVGFALVTLLFALLYKTLPDTKVPWGAALAGALFGALLYTPGKYLIGLYLGRGTLTSAFGAAGSVVVLLAWVFYTAQILLLGAELAAAYTRRSAARASVH